MTDPRPKTTSSHLIIMGVAGSGKSTLMAALAARLGWLAKDGDDLHPPANVAKMARGEPLSDADREPWLAAIRAWMDHQSAAGHSTLVACSALRRSYRCHLRGDRSGVGFVWLAGDTETLALRLESRQGHFMGHGMLASQIATLEPPEPGEILLRLEITDPTEVQVTKVLTALGFRV